MDIILNGEPTELPGPISVADLIKQLDLTDKRLAIELNLEIVPRSQLSEQMLAAGDRVEIVQAIGGG